MASNVNFPTDFSISPLSVTKVFAWIYLLVSCILLYTKGGQQV